MIERERQIASLFSICVGVMLLIILPGLLSTPAPDTAENTSVMPDGAYIDTSHLNYGNQVCEDILLPDTDLMIHRLALICIHEEMELIINTDHLSAEKYDQIIQPVVDSLRSVAVQRGIRRNMTTMWAE